jgi:hypothetical protein
LSINICLGFCLTCQSFEHNVCVWDTHANLIQEECLIFIVSSLLTTAGGYLYVNLSGIHFLPLGLPL